MTILLRAHRTREQGPHHRKAPDGEDRPAYFIHLAEVAWMLQDAGFDSETVAARFLHDIIEDCDYANGSYGRTYDVRLTDLNFLPPRADTSPPSA